MTLLYYDKFFDIPLRGIIQADTTHRLAFLAEAVDDEEPMDPGDLAGVCCKVIGFECGENLPVLFAEKDEIFREWRRQFDAGLVDKSTHPIYHDGRYQRVSAQIDEIFNSLRLPQFEKMGRMLVEAGHYEFRPLETGCRKSAAGAAPIQAAN